LLLHSLIVVILTADVVTLVHIVKRKYEGEFKIRQEMGKLAVK
jgi:hypothetical protein